jgi:hypothetical protein
MHWRWKNCPLADKGSYSGKEKEPTVILEAVATHDLWIWHAFFGLPGTLNDITVLDRSPLFDKFLNGHDLSVRYQVNGNEYNLGYYLTDGIYPKFKTLIQSISEPQGRKNRHFAKMQEAYRKDVERAFGVLQARYAIIRHPGRLWDQKVMDSIMRTVIILHNMTIEDESGTDFEGDFDYHQTTSTSASVSCKEPENNNMDAYILRHHAMRDIKAHNQLKSNLIEHLWTYLGDKDE